ncbi:uncharacterized protein TNCV_2753271 [Trichonephila clavipes]|nr:uncharacterized protein TNCV_2753271 [Trichonephila clavipes]
MDVCKPIVPLRHRRTLNSRRAASPLVRLVEGPNPQGVLPLNWCGTELNRTVTCMVHKATANDRHTRSPLPW